MENSFVEPQKSNYQSEAQCKDSSCKSLPNKIGEKSRINDKELTHKSIWRSINIFSKIKKDNKAKGIEANANAEENNSRVLDSENYRNNKKCKTNKMDDESNLNKKGPSGSAGEESTSMESKSSFFGKMNLESLLKIFVDLHKKKQCSQSSKSKKQIFDSESSGKFPDDKHIEIESEEILEKCRSSSHEIQNNEISKPISQSRILLNPMNSPSLLKGNDEEDDSVDSSENMYTTSQTDSTLSLLKCVRLKLNNYLGSETTDDDGCKNRVDNVINPETEIDDQVEENEVKIEDNIVTPITADDILNDKEIIKKDAVSNEDCVTSDHCSYDLNIYDLETEIKCENFEEKSKNVSKYDKASVHNRESNDKKLAYAIVECDIKCMIKELLRESKNIKDSIVATGIEEEPIPQFAKISKYLESVPLCESLFNDLINTATNKHMNTLKNKKHLNVTFKQDVEEDVAAILGNLVENVLNTDRVLRSRDVYINFCLVQNNPDYKTKNLNKDPKTAKFRESKVYSLTKKFRKMPTSTRKIMYPPKVTVNNLSTNKYIKFMTVENSLINRIKRSAALLMALYDEMRDYTYYSCTSNILCELYESMVKQGLISVANSTTKKSIETVTVELNTTANEKNETSHQQVSETSKTNTSLNVKLFSPSIVPCTSSNNNPSNSIDLRISSSNDSVSSESDVEEVKPTLLLPNLKYTYQSDEEINTPEEVKMIDDNVSRNRECGNCTEEDNNKVDVVPHDTTSPSYMNVSINDDETFLKE